MHDIAIPELLFSYLLSIVIISILHSGVVTHLSSDVVGSIGVVDVHFGLPPEVSDLLALDQADYKEDQQCNAKGSC